jgi:hypothetical protein
MIGCLMLIYFYKKEVTMKRIFNVVLDVQKDSITIAAITNYSEISLEKNMNNNWPH